MADVLHKYYFQLLPRIYKKNGIFCEFFTLSISRSERVNIKIKLTLQAADEYTNNTGNPVIRKPRGLYVMVFYYTNQFPIEYHNSTNRISSTCNRWTARENGREP